MTYRDPYDPYSDRVNPSDPSYIDPAHNAGWSRGGVVGAIVAIVIVAAIIAYGTNRTSTNTATGPNMTTSEPSTTGEGDSGPAGAPSGIAR
jgi:hypothetical protein